VFGASHRARTRAENDGGIVATQAQFLQFTETSSRAKGCEPGNPARALNAKPQVSSVTALSLEFVATPEAVRDLYSAIPADISAALHGLPGFAGCLTMISDQESRLVTIITFWTGVDRTRRSNRNAQWVRKLISPYLDRCLRLRTFHAFLPAVSALADAFSGTNPLQPSSVRPTGEDVPRIDLEGANHSISY
jgi:hypothetical protein